MDPILTAWFLLEKHCENSKRIHMAFLDLEKAFDHIPQYSSFAWTLMENIACGSQTDGTISIGGEDLKKVKVFLDSLICNDSNSFLDTCTHVNAGWRKWCQALESYVIIGCPYTSSLRFTEW
ncbi:hypothetical protein E2320_001583 [Naja naja]|nr:hypothetical protein E2320_001583 [Naja naja]